MLFLFCNKPAKIFYGAQSPQEEEKKKIAQVAKSKKRKKHIVSKS